MPRLSLVSCRLIVSSASCVLGASLLTLAALSFAAPALAAPPAPSLAGTHPSSPGLSTTPRVYGSVSGISTSRIGVHSSAVTALGGEEGTITIYAQPGCAGPEAATGSVAEFTNSGIEVTVAPGSNTTFSATNSDVSGISGCSNNITYQQVSDPPSAPELTAVNPPSPADDNLPHLIGSADASATVAIFTNPGCGGSPVGEGSAATFAGGGIQVGVADNSTTTFYARASWAELPSACSSTSVTYQEVSSAPVTPPGPGDGTPGGSAGSGGGPASSKPPPAPKLRTVPGGRANNSTPLVTASSSGAALVRIFKNAPCSGHPVIAGTAAQLAEGLPVPVAENATTRFYGEAVSADGKTSDCSDPVSYAEDSSPPQTRITFGPGVKTRKHVVVFRFDDITEDPPDTTFLCKLDRAPWKACQAPLRLPRLGLKAHTLRVKGVDQAGNEEAGGAAWKFKVVRGA
jgi:hypothetical protein